MDPLNVFTITIVAMIAWYFVGLLIHAVFNVNIFTKTKAFVFLGPIGLLLVILT